MQIIEAISLKKDLLNSRINNYYSFLLITIHMLVFQSYYWWYRILIAHMDVYKYQIIHTMDFQMWDLMLNAWSTLLIPLCKASLRSIIIVKRDFSLYQSHYPILSLFLLLQLLFEFDGPNSSYRRSPLKTPSLVDNRDSELRVRWMCLWVFNWNTWRCYPRSLRTICTLLCVMLLFCARSMI